MRQHLKPGDLVTVGSGPLNPRVHETGILVSVVQSNCLPDAAERGYLTSLYSWSYWVFFPTDNVNPDARGLQGPFYAYDVHSVG